MSQPVTKAVIAAAGYGSRFLPQTKSIPKEMLPLVDKPVIQHIVEELVEAGIRDIIIVTSDGKPAIEEHFGDVPAGLRENLLDGGKHELLAKTAAVRDLASFTYVKQTGPYGNATPLTSSAHLLNGEPFIYTFADDFVVAKPENRFQQLLSVYHEQGGSAITCVRRDNDIDYTRYGYVGGEAVNDNLVKISEIIEKPKSREKAPSDLASVGGYVFQGEIIGYLQAQLKTYDASQGEFTIQTAMQQMMQDGFAYYGCNIVGGHFYDAGNPLEYMKTAFDFALKHDLIGAEFREFVLERSRQMTPAPFNSRRFVTPARSMRFTNPAKPARNLR